MLAPRWLNRGALPSSSADGCGEDPIIVHYTLKLRKTPMANDTERKKMSRLWVKAERKPSMRTQLIKVLTIR